MLVRTVSQPFDEDRSTSAELVELAQQFRCGGWLARLEAEYGRLPR